MKFQERAAFPEGTMENIDNFYKENLVKIFKNKR